MKEYQDLLTAGSIAEEYQSEIAHMKRLWEYDRMVPGFHAKFMVNPQGVVHELGLKIQQPEAMVYLLDLDKKSAYEQLPEEQKPRAVQMFKSFRQKMDAFARKMQEEIGKPRHQAFCSWRERQVNRCFAELGSRNAGIIHAPVVYELNLGCSVGCPFCGVRAGKLTKVAQYAAIKDLWRGVLSFTAATLGPQAAGATACYYACEPLDNPDLEKFTDDYFQITGMVPQMTTAVATRNLERTRSYLQHLAAQRLVLHRFSIRSMAMLEQVWQAFTPEELLYVQLLPQFPEAPANHFSPSGRARDAKLYTKDAVEPDTDTLACVSGFVINMAEQSLRLTTPCLVTDKESTGERLIAKEYFSDLKDFQEKFLGMINKYMVDKLPKHQVLKLRDTINFETTAQGVTYYHTHDLELSLQDGEMDEAGLHQAVLEQLQTGTKTWYEIMEALMAKGYSSICIMRCLKEFYVSGLLLEPYEM